MSENKERRYKMNPQLLTEVATKSTYSYGSGYNYGTSYGAAAGAAAGIAVGMIIFFVIIGLFGIAAAVFFGYIASLIAKPKMKKQ